MKKINIALMVIIIVLGIINVFGELDEKLVWILKDLSIVLTVSLPYILKKLFKLNISEGLIFVYIIFIFIAHYLGVIEEFYKEYAYFDKLAHTMSGILSAYVAYLLLKAEKNNSTFFNIVFIISFTFMVAGLWEIFEFTCNALFGGDAQKVVETGVDDTMEDIIAAFLGSILFTVYIMIKGRLKG